jgi:hypothetical protein
MGACAPNVFWLFSVSSASSSEEREEAEEAPTFGQGSSLFLCDTIEIFFTTQIQFIVNNHRRCGKAIVKRVGGQNFVFWTVFDDQSRPIPAGNVDLSIRSNR